MTTELNQTEVSSVTPEKTSFDDDPLSTSAQSSSMRPLMSRDGIESPSQPSSAGRQILHACVYIALRCSGCGAIRQAITELPAHDALPCPECGRKCSFVLLGSGLTKRDLPFHQVYGTEPTRWVQWTELDANSS